MKQNILKKIAIASILWLSITSIAYNAFADNSIDSLLNDSVNVDQQTTADAWTNSTTSWDNNTATTSWDNNTATTSWNNNIDSTNAIPMDNNATITNSAPVENNNTNTNGWTLNNVDVNTIEQEINPSIEISNDFKTLTVWFTVPHDLYDNKNIKVQIWLDMLDETNNNKIITLQDLQNEYPDVYNAVKNLKIKSIQAITDDWTTVDWLTYSTEDNPGAQVTDPKWLPYYWLKINIPNTSKYYWKNIIFTITVDNEENWQETLLPPEITTTYLSQVSNNQNWDNKPLGYLTTIDWVNKWQIIPIKVTQQPTAAAPSNNWPQNVNMWPQNPQPGPQQSNVKPPKTWVEDYLPFAVLMIILALFWAKLLNKQD